jgi:hypothetical protein
MKNRLTTIVGLCVLLFAYSGCEKDEDRAVLSTAGAPVLTASATTAVLAKDKSSETAVTYTWARADFGYAAAVSYTLQFDKKGGDFSKPALLTAGAATSRTVTVAELNNALSDLNLPVGTPAQVDVRVVASVGPQAPTQTSAVTSITATPYDACDVPALSWGLVGPAGDGWPGATDTDRELAYDCKARAYILRTTLSAGAFKFRANKNWGTNLGGAAGDFTAGVPLTPGGPDLTATAGTYTVKLVVVQDATGKVTGGTVTITP